MHRRCMEPIEPRRLLSATVDGPADPTESGEDVGIDLAWEESVEVDPAVCFMLPDDVELPGDFKATDFDSAIPDEEDAEEWAYICLMADSGEEDVPVEATVWEDVGEDPIEDAELFEITTVSDMEPVEEAAPIEPAEEDLMFYTVSLDVEQTDPEVAPVTAATSPFAAQEIQDSEFFEAQASVTA